MYRPYKAVLLRGRLAGVTLCDVAELPLTARLTGLAKGAFGQRGGLDIPRNKGHVQGSCLLEGCESAGKS
jgi:hypothetical protein